jgi:hypothetical protein
VEAGLGCVITPHRSIWATSVHQSSVFVHQSRAFWANEVVAVEDERQIVTRMKQKRLGRTAIILGTARSLVSNKASRRDQVVVLEASGGFLALQTQNVGTRFLTIREIWHPGWTASIDGEELRARASHFYEASQQTFFLIPQVLKQATSTGSQSFLCSLFLVCEDLRPFSPE